MAEPEAPTPVLPAADMLRAAQQASPSPPPMDLPEKWDPPSVAEIQAALPTWNITAFLGKGGMAAVYLGQQTSPSRRVAIKIMRPDLRDLPGFVERFNQESQLQASLIHSNIVPLIESGITTAQSLPGYHYIIIVYLPGLPHTVGTATTTHHSVEDLMQLGPVPLPTARRIIRDIASALAYAHCRKPPIHHRDVKPANFLLDADGNAYLADFGIASSLRADTYAALGLRYTRLGEVPGTIGYIAPELLRGGLPDARSDIFALGTSFYHMVTLCIDGPSLATLPQAPADPRYSQIIDKARHRDPALRYQSADDLLRDLKALDNPPPLPPPPLPKTRQAPLPQPAPSFLQHLLQQWQRLRPHLRALGQGLRYQLRTPVRKGLVLVGIFGLYTCSPTKPSNCSATHPFTNSLGMTFVPVPGRDVLIATERTTRRVYGRYTDACNGNRSWESVRYTPLAPAPAADDPVHFVSATDAKEFCEWLTKEEGGRYGTYRLAVSREWVAAMSYNGYDDYVDAKTLGKTGGPATAAQSVTGSWTRYDLHLDDMKAEPNRWGVRQFSVADMELVISSVSGKASAICGYTAPKDPKKPTAQRQGATLVTIGEIDPAARHGLDTAFEHGQLKADPGYYFRCVLDPHGKQK